MNQENIRFLREDYCSDYFISLFEKRKQLSKIGCIFAEIFVRSDNERRKF